MENEVIGFLRYLRIPVSGEYIKKFILSHPDYPSLLCISDLFENLRLDHKVRRVGHDDLEEFDAPYLLLPERSGIELTAVKHKNDFEKLKGKIRSGTAVIIQVEPTGKVLNEQHSISFKKEKTQKWMGLVVVFLPLAFLILSLVL